MPVSPEAIDAARKGWWEIVLTPTKPVPREWLEVAGRQVLCLASGGGQQALILAAAGATVTVLDNSPKQLDRDAKMAERHGLPITTVLGDMANLEMFADDSFDLIVHPCSNCFVPDVLPVWREAFRVLRRGCCLIAGFANPAIYLFDLDLAERNGTLEVKHPLPLADGPRSASEPMEFSHSLELQIGGQIAAGFSLTGFYQDVQVGGDSNVLNIYMPMFIATRALKVHDRDDRQHGISSSPARCRLCLAIVYPPVLMKQPKAFVSPYAKADVRKRAAAAIADALFVASCVVLAMTQDSVLFIAAGALYLLFRDALFIPGQSIGKFLFGVRVISLENGRPCGRLHSAQRNCILLVPGLNVVAVALEGVAIAARSPGTASRRYPRQHAGCGGVERERTRDIAATRAHGRSRWDGATSSRWR